MQRTYCTKIQFQMSQELKYEKHNFKRYRTSLVVQRLTPHLHRRGHRFNSWQRKFCTALVAQMVKNLPAQWECEGEVAQSCLTLRDPVDCSPPGSSVHGILQARALEWLPSPSPTCILLVADSRCCMAEANIILESNYPPIKKKINMVLVTSQK